MKKSILSILCALLVGLSCVLCGCNKTKFTVKDTLPDGNNQKVRVILLGGQSNASGCSRDDCLRQKVSPEQYAKYEAGFDNIYINYLAGKKQSDEFVKCSVRQGEGDGCFGPELGMADKLSELYPNEKFFIIKCAWGGTDLFEQWLSPSSEGKTGELYENFIRFTRTSLKYLRSKNYEVEIEGMCWMQGESDSFSVENATNYETHLRNFILDMRKDLKRYQAEDGIAFVDAYIADNPMYWVSCDLVNASKVNVLATTPMTALVDTITAGLSCAEEPEDKPDVAHYDSLSQLKLGNLFIQELVKFF